MGQVSVHGLRLTWLWTGQRKAKACMSSSSNNSRSISSKSNCPSYPFHLRGNKSTSRLTLRRFLSRTKSNNPSLQSVCTSLPHPQSCAPEGFLLAPPSRKLRSFLLSRHKCGNPHQACPSLLQIQLCVHWQRPPTPHPLPHSNSLRISILRFITSRWQAATRIYHPLQSCVVHYLSLLRKEMHHRRPWAQTSRMGEESRGAAVCFRQSKAKCQRCRSWSRSKSSVTRMWTRLCGG
mmetsp:Transcript_9624/g.22480  ORF Transcript_9624/g.22480 Transcript_9624/m.22480 type:complete len:235 (-) Transcript_9624:55-759(-)